jgi:dihydroorotate dehydrogenase
MSAVARDIDSPIVQIAYGKSARNLMPTGKANVETQALIESTKQKNLTNPTYGMIFHSRSLINKVGNVNGGHARDTKAIAGLLVQLA